MTEEAMRGWRKLHNEELHNLNLRQTLLGWPIQEWCDWRGGGCRTHERDE